MNLGFHDLQAWDEALYTVRAQGILKFGGWIDQSAFAIDGLYSSLHPPLQVWLTVGLFSLLDVNEYSARILSALAGAATLFVVAALGKRLANSTTGLVAALLFGLNPFVTFFARQGQFDSLLVFFLTLSAYYYIRSTEDISFRWPVLAGFALGAALMTKLFVALGLPLAVIAFLFMRKRPLGTVVLKQLGVSLAVAGLVALPWHAYRTRIHADGTPLF
ncbi:MAG TPA: glycosyltransferase family 39 protein, partial [Bacteroidota bacterium]